MSEERIKSEKIENEWKQQKQEVRGEMGIGSKKMAKNASIKGITWN